MSQPIPTTAREIVRRRVLRYFLMGVVVDATVIGTFATHPQWLMYFYSSRFPLLTELIFAVFFIGLAVTYFNFIRLVWEERALIRAARRFFARESGEQALAGEELEPASLQFGLGNSFVAMRIADLAEASAEGVASPASVASDEVAAREEIHGGLAKYVTAILTMLGLVGTFLGLIIAIEGISAISAIEDREAFVHGVKSALDGMSTAFSTSLAGIFGAVVLGFERLMFHFAQVSFLARLDRLTERYLEPLFVEPGDGGDVLPGAGELNAFTEALRAWRLELERVQGEMAEGVEGLLSTQQELGGSIRQLADSIGSERDRLGDLEKKLDELRWYVGRENATLLGLVGHVASAEEAQALADPDAAPPEGGPPAAGPDDLALEVQRTNQLLGRIYGEIGMAVRSATFKLEEGQNVTNRSLAKLIQRIESSAGSSAEQIQLLRTILGHVGKDDERMSRFLETLRQEAGGS